MTRAEAAKRKAAQWVLVADLLALRPMQSLGEERLAAMARIFGVEQVRHAAARYANVNSDREVRRWTKAAEDARTEAEALKSLTPREALARIERAHAAEARKVAARTARQVEAERLTTRARTPGPDPRGRNF